MTGANISTSIIRNCLIISLPLDFNLNSIEQFQNNILCQIKNASVQKVLIDVSAIGIMDRKTFITLSETSNMICLMGGQTVFAGFQPGVASSLVDLEVETDYLNIAPDLEEGLEMLENIELELKETEKENTFFNA